MAVNIKQFQWLIAKLVASLFFPLQIQLACTCCCFYKNISQSTLQIQHLGLQRHLHVPNYIRRLAQLPDFLNMYSNSDGSRISNRQCVDHIADGLFSKYLCVKLQKIWILERGGGHISGAPGFGNRSRVLNVFLCILDGDRHNIPVLL